MDVRTDNGIFTASVPSGASTGAYEACELRDGGKAFHGKGVQRAIDNINNLIGPYLVGMDESDQTTIDNSMIRLDGTPNKANLGANAILGVSLAVARAGTSIFYFSIQCLRNYFHLLLSRRCCQKRCTIVSALC